MAEKVGRKTIIIKRKEAVDQALEGYVGASGPEFFTALDQCGIGYRRSKFIKCLGVPPCP